jgi:hypothetical protein
MACRAARAPRRWQPWRAPWPESGPPPQVIPRSLAHNCGADVVRATAPAVCARSRPAATAGLTFKPWSVRGELAQAAQLRVVFLRARLCRVQSSCVEMLASRLNLANLVG